MKIWISKRKAFRTKKRALVFLTNQRDDVAHYRRHHGGLPPSEIIITGDKMYFTYGCDSKCVRYVDLE